MKLASSFGGLALLSYVQGLAKQENCYYNDKGIQYLGWAQETFGERECIRWDDLTRHNTEYRRSFLPHLWPDEDLTENYCRNPDKRNGGPWCFTKSSSKEWESCNVAPCECNVEKIGDGECDFVNNQEPCGYDGGDCCLSTCHCLDIGKCKVGCDCSNMWDEHCGGYEEGDCRDPSVLNHEGYKYNLILQTGRKKGADRQGKILVSIHYYDGTVEEVDAGDNHKAGAMKEIELELKPQPILSINVALHGNTDDDWYCQSGVAIEAVHTNRMYLFQYSGWLNKERSSLLIPRLPPDTAMYTVRVRPGFAYLGASDGDLYIEITGEGPQLGIAGETTERLLLSGGFETNVEATTKVFAKNIGDISHADLYGSNSEDRVFLNGGIEVSKTSQVVFMPGSKWIPELLADEGATCLINNEADPTRYIAGSYNVEPFHVILTIGDDVGAGRKGQINVVFKSHSDYPTRVASLGQDFERGATMTFPIFVQNQGTYQCEISLEGNTSDDVFIKTLVLHRPTSNFRKEFYFEQWLNTANPIAVTDSHDRDEASDDGLADLEFDTYQFFQNFRFKEVDIENDKLECALEEGCLYQMNEIVKGEKMGNIRALLNFETTTWNVGDVTFFAPPTQTAVYHECHKHYHGMQGYASYHITNVGSWQKEAIVLTGHKASHCVMDSTCARSGRERLHKCNNQGIQPGCADIYNAKLDCQWIDITPLKEGVYNLNVYINVEASVPEKSYDNNEGHILFKYEPHHHQAHHKIAWACLSTDESATECPPDAPKFNQLRLGITKEGEVDPEPGSRRWPLRENYNDGDRWN